MSSIEDAEPLDFEVDSRITGAEIAEVVEKLHCGRASGLDEICPEFLQALDVVLLLFYLVDTSLKHCMDIGGSTSELAEWGVGSPF